MIHPSRGRAEQAIETARLWKSNSDNEFEYILSIDDSDPVKEKYMELFGSQSVLIGSNKSAIEAINEAAKICMGDIIVVVSDDFSCEKGWDTALLNEIGDRTDFVMKTVDGLQPLLVTLPIMDRIWYERYGYVYFGGYGHLYADQELTAVAKMTGHLIMSDLSFPHDHYTTGRTPFDAINEKNDATDEQGKSLFAKRMENNFGIENPVMKYEDIVWQPLKLSILIPTTAERSEVIKPLLQCLSIQATNEIEILLNNHETDCVGKKRNDLLKEAKGEYIVFIDSDDQVSDNYVALILEALRSKPDCLGINGVISTNRTIWKRWYISREYTHWYEVDDVYYRTTNHISPVKRELALKAGFPEISIGEDAVYSKRLRPWLHSEVKIEQSIYHYDYFSKA